MLFAEQEDDLRIMMGYFVELCKRRCVKLNKDKSKETVLGSENGSVDEVNVDGRDEMECLRKAVNGRKVAIRSLMTSI